MEYCNYSDESARSVLERCGRLKREEIVNRTIKLDTIPKFLQEKYNLTEGKIINGAKFI